jgi:outer membrane protein assembly factor BamB
MPRRETLKYRAAPSRGMLRVALAALLVAALLVPAAQGEWASFRGDARNSGTVPGTAYQVYQDVWWNNKTAGDAQLKASPVLKDGILIVADLGARTQTTVNRGTTSTGPVASPTGIVRALDAESGKEIWRHTMTGPIESTPAISGERVYVADFKGVLRALNLRSGAMEHEYKTHGATMAPITLHEGKLFLGTEAGEMKAYLASTLTPLWTFKTSEYGVGTASYDKDNNFIGCKATTGKPLFSPQPIRSGGAVFDKKVFFGSMNHYVFAVDEEGLGTLKTKPMWVFKTGDVVVGAPTINELGSNSFRVVVGSYDGKVYSFTPSPAGQGADPCYGMEHTSTWTYNVPSTGTQVSKVHSSPASLGNRIYVGANNGRVYSLDATNGQRVWEAVAGDERRPVTSSPVVANGVLVVGSEDKNVYWLNAANGTQLKTFATQSAVVASPAIDGARAFVASQDGTVYMFGPEIPKRPDLVVQSIAASETGLLITVRNQGDAAAGATTLRLFMAGTFLTNLNEAGQSSTVTHTVQLASGTATSFRAIIDPDNAVVESVESNNERSQSVVPPTPTKAPDSGGFKIPGPGVPLLLVALAALALRARRR